MVVPSNISHKEETRGICNLLFGYFHTRQRPFRTLALTASGQRLLDGFYGLIPPDWRPKMMKVLCIENESGSGTFSLDCMMQAATILGSLQDGTLQLPADVHAPPLPPYGFLVFKGSTVMDLKKNIHGWELVTECRPDGGSAAMRSDPAACLMTGQDHYGFDQFLSDARIVFEDKLGLDLVSTMRQGCVTAVAMADEQGLKIIHVFAHGHGSFRHIILRKYGFFWESYASEEIDAMADPKAVVARMMLANVAGEDHLEFFRYLDDECGIVYA